MKPEELDSLIDACLEDSLTDRDAARLSDALTQSPSARARYWDAAAIHGLLENAMQQQWLSAAAGASPTAQRSRWPGVLRPIAAGILFGIATASAVWAYAVPKRPRVMEVQLADAGFDASVPITDGGVPDRPGSWSADPHEILQGRGNVRPHNGTHMLRFVAASAEGNNIDSNWIASDLYQVVELPGSGLRTVKVRAWFNAETPEEARFHLQAIAGPGDARTAPKLWAQRKADISDALASSRAMVIVDDDPASWETGEVTLEVPAEARVLVIALAAYRVPTAPPAEWFPGQFADDVTVTVQEVTQ